MKYNKIFLYPLSLVFTFSLFSSELDMLKIRAQEEAQALAKRYGSFQKWKENEESNFNQQYVAIAEKMNSLRAAIQKECPEKFGFVLQFIEKIIGITYPEQFESRDSVNIPLNRDTFLKNLQSINLQSIFEELSKSVTLRTSLPQGPLTQEFYSDKDIKDIVWIEFFMKDSFLQMLAEIFFLGSITFSKDTGFIIVPRKSSFQIGALRHEQGHIHYGHTASATLFLIALIYCTEKPELLKSIALLIEKLSLLREEEADFFVHQYGKKESLKLAESLAPIAFLEGIEKLFSGTSKNKESFSSFLPSQNDAAEIKLLLQKLLMVDLEEEFIKTQIKNCEEKVKHLPMIKTHPSTEKRILKALTAANMWDFCPKAKL